MNATDRRSLRLFVGVALLLLALSAATLAALLVWALPGHIGSISINGEELALGPASLAHWLVATLVVLALLLVLLLVVPFALLLGLALPLALALIGVLLVVLLSAIVFSPLLLAGWLLWRAVRADRPRDAATIAR